MQTTPSAAPAAPQGATQAASQGATTVAPVGPSGPFTAREIYEAAQMQRRLIRDQLSSAEGQRDEVARELRQPDVQGVDKEGLEQQLRALDIRVLDLRQQLADAQLRESQAAAMPGSTQPSPEQVSADRFEVAMTIGVMLTLVLAVPLVIAYARRLWKKSAVTLSMTPELDRRLDTIERAIETTAVEVERIGEGQRFVTQLMASRVAQEQASLGAPKESR